MTIQANQPPDENQESLRFHLVDDYAAIRRSPQLKETQDQDQAK